MNKIPLLILPFLIIETHRRTRSSLIVDTVVLISIVTVYQYLLVA